MKQTTGFKSMFESIMGCLEYFLSVSVVDPPIFRSISVGQLSPTLQKLQCHTLSLVTDEGSFFHYRNRRESHVHTCEHVHTILFRSFAPSAPLYRLLIVFCVCVLLKRSTLSPKNFVIKKDKFRKFRVCRVPLSLADIYSCCDRPNIGQQANSTVKWAKIGGPSR